jgi:hypothetical protein
MGTESLSVLAERSRCLDESEEVGCSQPCGPLARQTVLRGFRGTVRLVDRDCVKGWGEEP